MVSSIFNVFGRSPLRPLQKHMRKSYACAKRLKPFFDAAIKADWAEANNIRGDISALERRADELKRELRLHLPKSLFMPVPRADILQILVIQDQIANKAKDISGLVMGRNMQLPDKIVTPYMEYLQRSIDAAKQANKAVNELDELLETSFRGQEARIVKEMIVQLHQLEHDTDEMQIDIRRQIFHIEHELEPINAIFLYKIIEWTGALADRAQNVGDQLLLMLAR